MNTPDEGGAVETETDLTCAAGGGDHLSFIVDQGSELEYHLEVRLPLPPASPGSADAAVQGSDDARRRSAAEHENQHQQQRQRDIVLRELERVYCAEDLPEWQRDSFLAVAAALADGAGEWDDTAAAEVRMHCNHS